jgi:hypothetical protein
VIAINWKDKIFLEALQKGMDLSLVEVLVDEWEQEYSDMPEDLDDLILELNSAVNY